MKVVAIPIKTVPIIKAESEKIRKIEPKIRIAKARAMVISLPNRRLSPGTSEESTPKQIKGMVVKIPNSVTGMWKLVAISFTTDGSEVNGDRIQAPRRKSPRTKKKL